MQFCLLRLERILSESFVDLTYVVLSESFVDLTYIMPAIESPVDHDDAVCALDDEFHPFGDQCSVP